MFRLVLCCLMFVGCSSEKTASVPGTPSTACEANSSCEELSDCVDDACQGLDTRGDAPAVEEAHGTLETIGAEHRSDDTMQSSDAGFAPTLASPCATALEGQGALTVGGVKYEFSTAEGTFHQALLEPNDASGCLG